MLWDEDKAASRCTRMWIKLGRSLETLALAQAEARNPNLAIEAARRADVCFWMATGVLDSISMKDIVSKADE